MKTEKVVQRAAAVYGVYYLGRKIYKHPVAYIVIATLAFVLDGFNFHGLEGFLIIGLFVLSVGFLMSDTMALLGMVMLVICGILASQYTAWQYPIVPPESTTTVAPTVPGTLSAAERDAIGDAIAKHVQACWVGVTALEPIYHADLNVTTDANGIARAATIDPFDQSLNDPVFEARAIQAVLDPHCAKLPIPANLRGATFMIRFYGKSPD